MNIAVGIPTVDGKVTIEVASFLYTLSKGIEHFTFELIAMKGTYPRDYARNQVMQQYLERVEKRKYEALWWLDADMLPTLETLKLLGAVRDLPDYHIYTARTLALMPQYEPPFITPAYSAYHPELEQLATAVPEQDAAPMEVKACGFGCTIIRNEALLDRKLWYSEEEQKGAPAVFRDDYTQNGRVRFTEDVAYTLKASEAGYKILYCPSVSCGHAKSADVLWMEQQVVKGWERGLKEGFAAGRGGADAA